MDAYLIKSYDDVVGARHLVRAQTKEMGFGLVDQTRLTTVASELTRNILLYAGEGKMILDQVINGTETSLKIDFIDEGPGIPDVELAMKDGYTSGEGLGNGLPGSKRLVDEFRIVSEPGKGTRITVIKWLPAGG